jgi:alpha-glucoside transport system permease protein
MSATDAPVKDTEADDEKAIKVSQGGSVGDPRTLAIVRTIVFSIVVVWLIPAIGLLLTSVRSRGQIEDSGWWTIFLNPFDYGWTLENYSQVLSSGGFDTAFVNTLVVSVPATIIPITIAAFAAYAFSWMEFKGRYGLFILVVALLVVPLHVSLIPILRLYGGSLAIPFTDVSLVVPIQLNRTFLGIWLAHTGFGLPLAIYLLKNYIGSLPSELIESARIAGADHFAIFTRLVMPLSVPALAAFGIFQFLWVFNDFLVAFVFLGNQRGNQVLTIALQSLSGAQGQAWHLLTAGAFVSMILPMVVFFSLQRYFVRGMTAGAVKG